MNVRMFRRSSGYYVDIRVNGERMRRALGTSDEAEARRMVERLTRPPETVEAEPLVVNRRIDRLRQRSKKRGQECELTADQLRLLISRSGGRCEVTGIPFSDWTQIGWARAPFAATVDRLDNSKPYSMSNCRLVCQVVNVALNEWGEKVFARVARAYLADELRAHVPLKVPENGLFASDTSLS